MALTPVRMHGDSVAWDGGVSLQLTAGLSLRIVREFFIHSSDS